MTTVAEGANETRPDTFPTSISDLQFPSSARNFSSTLSSLKRSTLSAHNRLRSIQHDSRFVQAVASEHNLPLIANERCGSWYIPPGKKAGSAYFKSTDGHFGQWAFSMRRLNLQVLDIIGAAGGCVIVDSTRRGKSMPDALSKTVPIWCAVLNRLLFPEWTHVHQLHTPRSAVSLSEYAQIEARIEEFVRSAQSLQLDISALRASVKQPLVPFWITPDFEDVNSGTPSKYNTVICCTASRRVEGTEASENGYIQGAADDHEAWSQSLTPALFWAYSEELLEMPEEDISGFVHRYQAEDDITGCNSSHAVRITPTSLYIGALSDNAHKNPYDSLIIISDKEQFLLGGYENQGENGPPILHVQCKPGKLGSRALRTHLEQIIAFVTPLFSSKRMPRTLITCHDCKDLSIGVALAILCLFYDDYGEPRSTASWASIDKTMIRQRLAKITTVKPDANPSKATLQSVHAFLMP